MTEIIPAASSLSPDQTLNLFKFYEEAAEKAKAHAWSQTTWILTLNAAILGFSVNFYASNSDKPAFFAIELLSSGVGVVLCGFLVYLLNELGGHISHYWLLPTASQLDTCLSFHSSERATPLPPGRVTIGWAFRLFVAGSSISPSCS